jgi:hypothetical protein
MRVIKAITSCAAAAILSTNAAYAEEEPRGAITAISHVAAGVSADTPHNGFRWAETRQDSGPAVNTSTASRQSGFRWASHPGNQSNGQTAAVEKIDDVDQSGSRWVIRNNASQAASRWVIRNDTGQAASRWVIRNDASQAASRWVIRNDTGQAASRWVIRNDADQTGSRWVIR